MKRRQDQWALRCLQTMKKARRFVKLPHYGLMYIQYRPAFSVGVYKRREKAYRLKVTMLMTGKECTWCLSGALVLLSLLTGVNETVGPKHQTWHCHIPYKVNFMAQNGQRDVVTFLIRSTLWPRMWQRDVVTFLKRSTVWPKSRPKTVQKQHYGKKKTVQKQ